MSYYSSRAGPGSYRRGYSRNYGRRNTYTSYKKHEINSVDSLVANSSFGTINGDLSTGGYVQFINGTVTGNNVYNRNGNSIVPKSIRILGSIAPLGYSTFPGPQIRMAIVYDQCPTGTEPAFSDIFSGIAANSDPILTGFTAPNPSYTARFRIIRDYQVQLGFVSNQNNTVYSVSPAQINIKEYSKLWDKQKNSTFEVQYNQTNVSSIGAVTTGAFYIVLYNSQASGTMVANMSIRFSFMDRTV